MTEHDQANTYTFQIEPDDRGGRSQTVTINRQNILPLQRRKGGQKAPPISAYILLGFDTEYQTFEPITREQVIADGGAQNELLSYQFCRCRSGLCWNLVEQPPVR